MTDVVAILAAFLFIATFGWMAYEHTISVGWYLVIVGVILVAMLVALALS